MKSAASGTILLLLFIIDLATSKIFVSLTEAQKEVHDNFFVLCRDPDEGAKVQWRNPRNKIIGSKNDNSVWKIDTKHGSQLVFSNVRKEDEGTYVCKSRTDQAEFNLSVTDSQELPDYTTTKPHKTYPTKKPFRTVSTTQATCSTPKIEDPIKFVNTTTKVVTKPGTDIQLRCEATNADVEILIDGKEVETGPKYKVAADALLILNATWEDNKHNYSCRAYNSEIGIFKTRDITVKVEHPPIPPINYVKEEVIYGYLGGFVTLTCKVEAEPAPTFTWLHKKKVLPIGLHVPVDDNRTSVITLYLESPKDFDEYKCVASNKLGTYTTLFTLEMGTRPSPPEFLEIQDANSTSMSIYIVPPNATNEQLKPTGFKVEYRPLDEPYWNAQTFPEIAEDNIYVLNHLTKNTTYQVRAATLNRAGPSLFTNETEYTTSSALVLATVPNLCILCVVLLLTTSVTDSLKQFI